MEVAKIILMKVRGFCQLASHKHGSFLDLRFASTKGTMDFFPTDERGLDGVSLPVHPCSNLNLRFLVFLKCLLIEIL